MSKNDELFSDFDNNFSTLNNKVFPINYIDAEDSLYLKQSFYCHAPIMDISLSPNGKFVAVCNLLGQIYLFYANENNLIPTELDKTQEAILNVEWELISVIQEVQKEFVEEFICLSFSPCGNHIICAGCTKSRHKFDYKIQDLEFLGAPLVLFDLNSLEKGLIKKNQQDSFIISRRFESHSKTISSLKVIKFKDVNYIFTCSQDGMIRKWKFSQNWKELENCEIFYNTLSSANFAIEIVPDTKFIIVVVNEGFKLFDIESCNV